MCLPRALRSLRAEALHRDVLWRCQGGHHTVSAGQRPPALLGWATGNLLEPKNNPQVGMANMRTIMSALQKAKREALPANTVRYLRVTPPSQQRETRIVKNQPPERIAAELLEWIEQE